MGGFPIPYVYTKSAGGTDLICWVLIMIILVADCATIDSVSGILYINISAASDILCKTNTLLYL